MMEPIEDTRLELARVPMLAVFACVVGVVVLFFLPDLVLDFAREAAAVFFP
jgi:hypothetical protein